MFKSKLGFILLCLNANKNGDRRMMKNQDKNLNESC